MAHKEQTYSVPASRIRWPRRDVPGDAVDLARDIALLEQVLKLLKQVNPLSTGLTWTQNQRDSCDRSMRTTTAVIRGWERHASRRLASEYLAP